jgi:CHAT domain-containing protein/tetratricopeptide (TPR) repeat protein
MYTLGNLYQQRLTGEPVISQERARMAYEMALDHWPPSSTIEIARTRAALAGVHLNRLVDSKHSNSASAIAHAGASLQVLTAEQSPLEYLAANVTLGLAIGTDPQRLDTAIDVIANALASTEKITAPPERAHSLTQLAFLFGRRAGLGHEDDVDRAVTAYEQALELSPAPTQSRMECLRSLGGLLLRHRRWTKAVAAFDEAHALELQLDTGFSGPARRARLAAASAAGMRWAYALARAGNLERAVVIMDRFRARELRDALGKRHPDLQRLQTAAPELHRRYLDATSRVSAIDAAERERSMVKVQGKAVLAPEGLEADFAERRRALDELLAAIRRTPGFDRFNADAEISDIWKAVLPNKPLAYLVTTEVGTLALLLQQDSAGPRIDIIRDDELNSARLQRLLVEWPSGGERSEGHLVCRPDPTGSEKLSLSWEGEQPTGGYLVGQISDPQHLSAGVRAIRETFAGLMAKLVGSIGEPRLEYLQLVTTGKLGLLPLHAALPGAMNGQELQAVSIVPSAVLLDTLRTADAEKARRKATLVGVANPLPHEEPLPFAPFELARIMRRFPGASKSAEEFGATREIVLKLLTREAHEDPIAYLHMACHGRYDLTQPLDSELSLAGGQGLKLIELLDGDLFAGIRLVTLSACQTAVTDVNEVPDEMGSLAAGFLAAGATGVVATLWAVDDLACALLFDRFYGELIRPDGTRAMEPAIALSRAQQWLRTLTARSLAALFEDAAHEQALPLLTSALAYFRERPGDEMCFADAEFWAGYIYLGA